MTSPSAIWRPCLPEAAASPASPASRDVPDSASAAKGVGLRLSREQREHVRSEVIRRTVQDHVEMVRRSKDLSLEVIINDAVYQEQERLRGGKGKEAKEQLRFWNKVARQFHQVSEAERERILERIAGMYV